MAAGQRSKQVVKKAVVGKQKKKTEWWKKLFVGSAVAVLILSVGYTGYNWWTARSIKAKAAGYKTLAQWGGAYVTACRPYGTAVKYTLINYTGVGTLYFDYSIYTGSGTTRSYAGGSRVPVGYGYTTRTIWAGSSSMYVNGGILNSSNSAWLNQGWITNTVGSLPTC